MRWYGQPVTGRIVGRLLGLALTALVTITGCTEDQPSSVPVAEVIEDHEHYHVCGSETIHLPDGRVFYTLLPEDMAQFDESSYSTASGDLGGYVVAASPLPGPGDDTGVLTIYEDGMAHWLSDNGTFEGWLTDEAREYNWEC